MVLSAAIDEAWDNVVQAFRAIEESGRLYGPNSEEVRLAEAAFDQWKEEYLELTKGL